MSLVRAFTQRRKASQDIHSNLHIGRAASHRGGRPVLRSQISSPVALVSTTNPLSYEAPDIKRGRSPVQLYDAPLSSSASSTAGEDSDASTLSIRTQTDASSIEENSPTSPEPEPNHLSCYFKPAVDTTHNRTPSSPDQCSFDAPVIPKRVPSHSKKAHESVHLKRSIQRMMSPPASIVRNSSEMFKQPVEAPRDNPFGNELAQLDEVAEELNHAVRGAEADADAAHMQSFGLAYYDASDYLSEIQSLIYDTFMVEEPVWI